MDVTKINRFKLQAMPAGPEMNLLVEEHVMLGSEHYRPAAYSTDDSTALQVLWTLSKLCTVRVWIKAGEQISIEPYYRSVGAFAAFEKVEAPTFALAVCRAALLATIGEPEPM